MNSRVILNWLSGKKRKIEYYKQSKVIAEYNNIVAIYNEGVTELNDFIYYRNNQFMPFISDDKIKKMVDDPMNKLLNSQELLNNLQLVNNKNASSVSAVKKVLLKTIKHATEQREFVAKYLSKPKGTRKSMFSKTTRMAYR